MAASEEVSVINAENNVEYKLILNKEDAKRARRDINFATLLLQKVKENALECDANVNNSEPSTSTTTTSTENESTEGTHIWTKPETLLLLDLYSERKDEYQNGKGTVKQYWDKIAKEMQEKGYDVTRTKCSTKFQALKRTYKTILDHNNKSGNNRKEWEYLQVMNELFGEKPWVKPMTVAGSHIEEKEKDENTPQKKCNKKRKLNTYIQDFIACNKEEQKRKRELREKQHEEKITAFKRLENLLEKFLEKEDK